MLAPPAARLLALALPLLAGGCLDWSRAASNLSDGGAPADSDSAVATGAAAADGGNIGDSGSPGSEGGAPSVGPGGAAPDAASAEAGAGPEPDASVWAGDPNAPVLVLHMDEASWRGTAGEVRDQSAAQNHGQAIDGANTVASGRFGRAASLAGSHVLVPDSPSLHVREAFSVSVWFYADDLSSPPWPGIVAKRNGFGDQEAFTVFLDPDRHVDVDVAGNDNRFVSKAVVTPGLWHHVALVYDGARAEEERVALYLDGALDTVARETAAEIPAFSSPLYVGNLPVGGDRFTGRIDELAIWRRALSESEVAALYQEPPSP
jgi:Concanavalin A-like lectin/glucanases superfamily